MENNENNYEGAKREEKKKNKKNIFNREINLVRGHSFTSFAKKAKI